MISNKIKSFLKRFTWLVNVKRKIQFSVRDATVYARAVYAHFKVKASVRRLRDKSAVKVAFIVISDTQFQLEGVFRLMLADPRYEPYIIITSQVNISGIDHRACIEKLAERMSSKYNGRVLSSFQDGDYVPIADKYDMFVVTSPYDELMDVNYRIETLAMHAKPVILTNYTYYHGSNMESSFASTRRGQNFVWRYYSENEGWKKLLEAHHLILRQFNNVIVSGYPKLDLMSESKSGSHNRKKIILCPHHSVRKDVVISFGNFLRYAEFFLSLPRKYPNIDWVFRPHPLLKCTLETNGLWKAGQWEHYISVFTSTPNATYRPDGSYYDMFLSSDAMIQDCCSFLPEYHCTGHPQCYMIQNMEYMESQLRDWGMELLSHAYTAENEQEIIRFIDDVVLGGNDPKAEERKKFVREKLLVNYPHVNEWIMNDIKKALSK